MKPHYRADPVINAKFALPVKKLLYNSTKMEVEVTLPNVERVYVQHVFKTSFSSLRYRWRLQVKLLRDVTLDKNRQFWLRFSTISYFQVSPDKIPISDVHNWEALTIFLIREIYGEKYVKKNNVLKPCSNYLSGRYIQWACNLVHLKKRSRVTR